MYAIFFCPLTQYIIHGEHMDPMSFFRILDALSSDRQCGTAHGLPNDWHHASHPKYRRKILKLGGGFNCCLCSSLYMGKWSNLTNIFQMGWNHQLKNHTEIKYELRMLEFLSEASPITKSIEGVWHVSVSISSTTFPLFAVDQSLCCLAAVKVW